MWGEGRGVTKRGQESKSLRPALYEETKVRRKVCCSCHVSVNNTTDFQLIHQPVCEALFFVLKFSAAYETNPITASSPSPVF